MLCKFAFSSLLFEQLANINRKKTWFLTSIASANGKGSVECFITTTKRKETAIIYFVGYFVGTNTKR